jgi:phage-related protein
MKALGFSDSTGVFQWLKDSLLSIQRGLKYIQENVIQPILDFEEIAIGYIGKIKKIINYILGLPAKILALLQDCLSNLYEAIANVFSDIAGGGDSNPFKDVIDTAKSTAKTLSQTVSMAAVAAGQAVAIVQVTKDIPNLVTPLKKGP